jgi:hypothetical protein
MVSVYRGWVKLEICFSVYPKNRFVNVDSEISISLSSRVSLVNTLVSPYAVKLITRISSNN